MKYTKGKWTVRSGLDYNGSYIISEVHEHLDMLMDNDREAWMNENKANANLIAAAPEMYSALRMAKIIIENLIKEVGYQLSDSHGYNNFITEIESAIAKAEAKE